MADLKPCPFCGCERIEIHRDETAIITRYRGICWDCCAQMYRGTKEEVAEAWNRRTKIETNIYDKEETYPNCTVQVLTNTVTGDVSVGWWENGGKEDGK